MTLPTITINEVSEAIQNSATNREVKKVLEGLLNDHMDLVYGNETDYTTGKRVLPIGTTIEDVDAAIYKESDQKFKDVFEKISVTQKSGDLTPQATSDGSWDPKFTPVLVLIRPNDK